MSSELRAADLAMTPAEIREVLAVHGVSLGERDFGILAARTEGWATGCGCPPIRSRHARGQQYVYLFVKSAGRCWLRRGRMTRSKGS